MNIKRTLETATATYDITGLTRKQFSQIRQAYDRYLFEVCHCIPEDDELYKKLEQMSESDTLIV